MTIFCLRRRQQLDFRWQFRRLLPHFDRADKAKSHVHTLVSDSGIEINDPSEILACVRDFYSKLYMQMPWYKN